MPLILPYFPPPPPNFRRFPQYIRPGIRSPWSNGVVARGEEEVTRDVPAEEIGAPRLYLNPARTMASVRAAFDGLVLLLEDLEQVDTAGSE